MSALEYPSTGNTLVDMLQGLQKVADGINDPNLKINRIQKTLEIVSANTLLEKWFTVSSWQLFSKHPDESPDRRRLFTKELKFVGQLGSFGYMLDLGIPVDALVLNFQSPEIVGADPDENRAFRVLTLQVPILAIASCSEAT